MSIAVRSEQALTEFIVRPDRSMNAHKLLAVYLLLLAGLLVIGLLAQLVFGAYPVLVFTLINGFGLGWGIKTSHLGGLAQEVVSVRPDRVLVERGPERNVQQLCFQTHWVQIELNPGRRSKHLLLRSHGRAVEIGTFLTEPDRLSLARQLRAAVAPYSGFVSSPAGRLGYS